MKIIKMLKASILRYVSSTSTFLFTRRIINSNNKSWGGGGAVEDPGGGARGHAPPGL